MHDPTPHLGTIDQIDEEYRIAGWAYRPGQPETELSLLYRGEAYRRIVADQYRADLEAAGVGTGQHAFWAPLPCEPSDFRPDLFEARFDDGWLVDRSGSFLSWAYIDLLTSPVTELANIEFTSRCNLRCVYCAVSQPDYNGRDMDVGDFDDILEVLKGRRIGSITVNGHGETTLLPGWHHRINALAQAGFRLNIITNFARLLSDEELQAMARISLINVSVDTHRPEILRQVRRRVSLGNILINMTATTAKAAELGLPPPTYVWSSVMNDKVAGDVVDYVRFGLACGVRNFLFCNLSKYPDLEDGVNVQHVTTLPDAQLNQFADDLRTIRRLIAEHGGSIDIAAGLPDAIELELTNRNALR